MDFLEFFREATRTAGRRALDPYPYQIRLAETSIVSRALRVPTGAGKTATAILSWLYRLKQGEPDAPRRLVYCLPMRVLVEQTGDSARRWTARVAPNVEVAILMGGEVEETWEIHSEKPFILIGTQDMLLSRALNRGYAMSRYKWPMHFGLLNNDCLWVCDEVQLMGSGLGTTTQLQAWREEMGGFGPRATWWMSATMDPSWLASVDYKNGTAKLPITQLGTDDLAVEELGRRYHASKPLEKMEEVSDAALAKRVIQSHEPGALTLVVLNRVERAQRLFQELEKATKKTTKPELLLAHSLFRASDRDAIAKKLQSPLGAEGRILVATQVIEAGVDLSARVLFTELAPWGSMVQRFGRCNRTGTENDALVYWIDVPDSGAKPYSEEELADARSKISALENVAIPNLESIGDIRRREPAHVIRRKDLLDLFDTTPDLTGAEIDVSRYIREEEDLDAEVFWREFAGERPDTTQDRPTRNELCPVPVYRLKEYLKDKTAWRWDPLVEQWQRVAAGAVVPGQLYLLHSKQGGYSEVGWNPKSSAAVPPIDGVPVKLDSYNADRFSDGPWRTIAEHTNRVAKLSDMLIAAVGLDPNFARVLRLAVRWHDRGKGHSVFQDAVPHDDAHPNGTWAKAPGRFDHYNRKHFRHELASALAILQEDTGLIANQDRDLTAYLAAAHHGKVRLSIRSMPKERLPDRYGTRFARGVWDGDQLPALDLGGGVIAPEVVLSLEPMVLGLSERGEISWAERVLALRDDPALGPLRLAYLEALIRAADRRASAEEATDA
jgi:CRISPR-associated endonuclease/helicase Cas3